MPTAEQLANLPVAKDGDGSTSVKNDDGSTTTTWPDGTSRVDYLDGSVMITFSDFAVLNIAPDGSRTLNDRDGNKLDPAAGTPLGPVPVPAAFGPDALLKILSGDKRVENLNEGKELVETFSEALKGELNPASWTVKVLESILETIKALGTEERGVQLRAWCYAVLYGALDMGTPPQPTFSGSLQGEAQDALDLQAWQDGVASGQAGLGDGTDGVALRNRLLLRVASDGGDAATTVNVLWEAAASETDDDQLLKAYEHIGWPQPTGA